MTEYFIRVYDRDGDVIFTSPDFEATYDDAMDEMSRIAAEYFQSTNGQCQGALLFRAADRKAA